MLALSVVAEAACLQDRRIGVDLVLDPRGRNPEPAEEPFLDEAVLRGLERGRGRKRSHPLGRADRHVLELICDDRGPVGEPVEQPGVVVLADEQLADLARRRVRRRVEEAEREPERDSG